MANEEHVAVLLQGVCGWNTWREENSDIQPDLSGANLYKADLRGANLQGADLILATLTGANLADANLYDADLTNAKLDQVKGLLASRLAGANVTNAKLPEEIQLFEGLNFVTEASKLARPVFLVILLGAIYTLLTILSTTDIALVLNAPSSLVPNLNTPIPTASFYSIAPCLIFFLYVYFLLYLQSIWETLSTLPAVFPSGRPLDKMVHPWLLNGLVRAHVVQHSAEHRQPLYSLNKLVSIFLAWWVAPVTLAALWFRYLTLHDWPWTLVQAGIFIIAIAFGMASYRLAKATLRGELRVAQDLAPIDATAPLTRGIRPVSSYFSLKGPVIATVLTILVSLGTIEGTSGDSLMPDPRSWIPSLFRLGGYSAHAELKGAELSTRPKDWWKANKVQEKALKGIRGANLRYRDLRHADAQGTFLAKADLRNSNLQRVKLAKANLREANLQDAKLLEANLVGANLQGANLQRAGFQKADLRNANLQGTDVRDTNLEKANLIGANLQGADLGFANLQKTRLSQANLQRARLFKTNLQEAFLGEAKFQEAFLAQANLQGADLKGAGLQKADLRSANLQGTDVSDANLEKANLIGANLQGADLNGTNFRGANLTATKGLTQEQLDEACGDEQTKLPPGLSIGPCADEGN